MENNPAPLRVIQKKGVIISLWHNSSGDISYGVVVVPDGQEGIKPGKHLLFTFEEKPDGEIKIKFSSDLIR